MHWAIDHRMGAHQLEPNPACALCLGHKQPGPSVEELTAAYQKAAEEASLLKKRSRALIEDLEKLTNKRGTVLSFRRTGETGRKLKALERVVKR